MKNLIKIIAIIGVVCLLSGLVLTIFVGIFFSGHGAIPTSLIVGTVVIIIGVVFLIFGYGIPNTVMDNNDRKRLEIQTILHNGKVINIESSPIGRYCGFPNGHLLIEIAENKFVELYIRSVDPLKMPRIGEIVIFKMLDKSCVCDFKAFTANVTIHRGMLV